MKKSRVQFLYAILAFLAAEAIQMIVVMGFSLIYGIMEGVKVGIEKAHEGVSDPASIVDSIEGSMSRDLMYLISVVAVLLCGIAFYFWYRYEIRGEIRGKLKKTFTIKNIILFFLLGIGCQFFISGVMCITQQYFTKLFEDYSKQMDTLTGGNDIVVLVLMILIAPVTEELIFRGIILHKASRAIPFWGANLLQAMLFGIYHMNIIQGIYAAFLGFVLGLVYNKFKTIFASMLLHMIINMSSLLLSLFPDNTMVYYILVFAGGIFTFGALAIILLSKSIVPKEITIPAGFPEFYNDGTGPS